MINPVTGNRKYLLIYIFIWALISGAHILFLVQYFSYTLYLAVIDSLISNLLFMILGIGIWYIVRYNDFEIKNFINLIAIHLISAFILVLIWISLANFIIDIVYVTPDSQSQGNTLVPGKIILGILYYMVIVLIYYLMIYYQNFKQRIEREGRVEARYKEAELNTLKAQINPHFIFNSLNSVSSLTISDPKAAQEMIVKLSDFFRMTLKREQTQFAYLEEEINFSKVYFEIEKIRFGDKLNYHVNCSKKFYNKQVPHLILQPLLENAIKHGVQESIDQVDINLDCSEERSYLILSLMNQFDPEYNSVGQGIGLNNVRDRLRIIYEQDNLLEISKQKGKFKVLVKIPFIS